MVKVSKCVIYIYINNQPWITGPTLPNINRDEYGQGLHYYPFLVEIDVCNGSYNTFDDFANM